MANKTLDQHIEASPDVRSGKPRIAGRRITVADLAIWHEWLGYSVDKIATEHDLTLADIYAALAYYHDNRTEIDTSIRKSQAFVQALQQQIPSKLPKRQ
ncbi:MAG: DUF433 domain-containing protein [Ardenticatenales bacterium]|nr:DUF433 domain-containing protein [Ardenticatenales bacterium]